MKVADFSPHPSTHIEVDGIFGRTLVLSGEFVATATAYCGTCDTEAEFEADHPDVVADQLDDFCADHAHPAVEARIADERAIEHGRCAA